MQKVGTLTAYIALFDLTQPQAKVLWSLVCAALLCVLRYTLPVLVGTRGEWRVNIRLSMLSRFKYRVLSDLLLFVDGKTVQIDHLVISNKAIFVLESKDMCGEISGEANAHKFKQVVDGKTIMFPSPVKQNSGHIYSVKQLLRDLPPTKLVSMVVFSSNATKLDIKAKVFVGYTREINKYIRSYDKGEISGKMRRRIWKVLSAHNIRGKKARLAHIEEVKKRKEEYIDKLNSMVCPRCGGTITLRQGKRGEFYGCSGFPDCKFNIDLPDYAEAVRSRRRNNS